MDAFRFIRQFTFKNNSMNCSSSVYRELSGRRASEAASDLHRYHTPFISDREVDFLECLRAWLWWWSAPLHPGPPVWWCMLRSPLVAASCKYQVHTVCPPLYIGLHRYFSRLIFSEIYMQIQYWPIFILIHYHMFWETMLFVLTLIFFWGVRMNYDWLKQGLLVYLT